MNPAASIPIAADPAASAATPPDAGAGAHARRDADLGLKIGVRPFTWLHFLFGVFCGSSACGLAALPMDWALIQMGVPVRLGLDAFYSGATMMCFAPLAIIGCWKLGVERLHQGLLASMVLFGPITIISAVAIAMMDGFVTAAPGQATGGMTPQDIAFHAYVRIARSAFLVTPSLIAFFVVYHHWLDRAPRGR